MNTNEYNYDQIKRELDDNKAVAHCATKYGNTGDPTSMKACYLLRHYPRLSVSQLAELASVSISAMSRCLKRLSNIEVVASEKVGKTVYYCLEENDFTRTLIKQLS